MRHVGVGIVGATAVLVAANMLGVAAAEAPTATSVRSVSVQGIATVPVAQGATAAAATAAYRLGMSSAVTDGQSKAEFLASKAGATLGSVQSIAEGGGSISCSDGTGSEYVEYTGEQPDFGYSQSSIVAPAAVARGVAAPSGAPTPRRLKSKRRKHRTPSAKKATSSGCTLSTQVSLSYSIS